MTEQPGRTDASTPVTVVAIGASAGGLDAMKAFFAAATPDPGIAYVVVTHLPARHASHLAELLDAAGAVRAISATDGERVVGGRTYVAPPGVRLRLSDGCLVVERIDGDAPASKPRRPASMASGSC
jgi:two-component system CheB/CheR fusion protein